MKIILIFLISLISFINTLNGMIDFKSDDLCKKSLKCTGSYDSQHVYSVKCLKQSCGSTHGYEYECSRDFCGSNEESCSLFVNVNKYLKAISKIHSSKSQQYNHFISDMKTCQLDKKYNLDILNDVCLNEESCVFKEQFIKISGIYLLLIISIY